MMEQVNAYAIKLTPDDNGTFLVTAPDFPELTSFGEDKEDALLRAKDALEEAIAARIAAREAVPEPGKKHRGCEYVHLDHQPFMKVLLWNTMVEQKVKKAELGRRLAAKGPTVDRIVDIFHTSTAPQIDAAFQALGKRVAGIALEDY